MFHTIYQHMLGVMNLKFPAKITMYPTTNDLSPDVREYACVRQVHVISGSSMDVNKVEVTVLFFAKSRELAGTREAILHVDRETTSIDLLSAIITQFTSLDILRENIVLSLNEEYISSSEPQELTLNTGDTIADSQQMDFIEISENVIHVERLTARVTSPTSGAISVFLGTTRDNFKGKKVKKLEYEAYEPMARKEVQKICDDIRSKWSVENIAIVHRIGEVPVCETSVAIVISSPHRKESLDAVQYGIDTLKATVPIWKKEIYEDGSFSWKENSECCGHK